MHKKTFYSRPIIVVYIPFRRLGLAFIRPQSYRMRIVPLYLERNLFIAWAERRSNQLRVPRATPTFTPDHLIKFLKRAQTFATFSISRLWPSVLFVSNIFLIRFFFRKSATVFGHFRKKRAADYRKGPFSPEIFDQFFCNIRIENFSTIFWLFQSFVDHLRFFLG